MFYSSNISVNKERTGQELHRMQLVVLVRAWIRDIWKKKM